MTQKHYNVVVDFGVEMYDQEIIDVFADAIHVEDIGVDQYQVGYGVFASSEQEAYRRGVNLVVAKLATVDVSETSWIDAVVYDE